MNLNLIDFESQYLALFEVPTMSIDKMFFSIEHDDFWPKFFLILYPSLENWTTHLTLLSSLDTVCSEENYVIQYQIIFHISTNYFA